VTKEQQAEPVSPNPARLTWWLAIVTLVFTALGMAYTLLWAKVVRHQSFYWIYPGDIWSTVRGAHFIGWGGLSFVYLRQTALITLPGYDLLLAPVVMLSSKLGLTEVAPGLLPPPKPTSWLLVGPFTFLSAGVAIFGADALARRLGVTRGVRRLLAVAVAVAVWPALVIWGHPEDVVAIGLFALALAKVLDGKNTSAAWLVGAAIAMQLYVLMLIPLFIGIIGWRKSITFCARAAVLPIFFAVAVLVPDFHHAWWTLTKQPNYPTVNHTTPWVSIAPRIAKGVVAAGPPRLGAFAFAAVAGYLTYRRRADRLWIMWIAMLVMVVRCVFETVFVPYYVMPAIVLAFVVVAPRNWWRRVIVVGTGVFLTVSTHWHFTAWPYWLLLLGPLAVLTLATWPEKRPQSFDAGDSGGTAAPGLLDESPFSGQTAS
jgi:hypothetical protein